MKTTKSAIEKVEMKTLMECMESLRKYGFTENFMAKANGLHALDSKKVYKPEDVAIVNFYRFEGESDPADNSILYAIETNDGLKGQLSNAYGAYADQHVTKFIEEVEEIEKKTEKVSPSADNENKNEPQQTNH